MKDLVKEPNNILVNNFLQSIVSSQNHFESNLDQLVRKKAGIFLTQSLSTIDNILDIIEIQQNIFTKKVLEPSVRYGIFILKLILKIYQYYPEAKHLQQFIENNLFFIDIDPSMIYKTKENIKKLYFYLFNQEYQGKFNGFVWDFTKKITFFEQGIEQNLLYKLYETIDYIIGNPPYVTLYGRRDKKNNEFQRIYYLENYSQFPKSLKNGKINYVMLFLEHSLDFLTYEGKLSFIIDMSFFETAYLHTRRYLLENTQINAINYNIKDFNVASGQMIIKLTKTLPLSAQGKVQVMNMETNQSTVYDQVIWYRKDDQYRFRLSNCEQSESIISNIFSFNDQTLKDLYPQKHLRTCTMLLDRENQFVFSENNLKGDIKIYPYHRGSQSLQCKFGDLKITGFFYYDKELQNTINEQLKLELKQQGIKNKKRIGLGEQQGYDYPKIYIRQSAKSIIAAYDDKPSAANNSLYMFTLRSNKLKDIQFLHFICAYLNSDLITFFCQKRQIIRYGKGKQPQIKISDLYLIPIPSSDQVKVKLANLVYDYYSEGNITLEYLLTAINKIVYDYYNIDSTSSRFIKSSISD